MGNCGGKPKDDMDKPEIRQVSTPEEAVSAVRWRSLDELKQMITTKEQATMVDPKTGNQPIHVASQNGLLDKVQYLVSLGADVTVGNLNGQTPLHMTESYEYPEVSEFLVSQGASMKATNNAGIPAEFGLDGERDLSHPLNALKLAETTDEVLSALSALKNSKPSKGANTYAHPDLQEGVDKAAFIQLGMKRKKVLGADVWTEACAGLFKDVIDGLP